MFRKYYGNKSSMLESSFNKIAGLIKKRLQDSCFPVNIAKFLRAPILKNTLEVFEFRNWVTVRSSL